MARRKKRILDYTCDSTYRYIQWDTVYEMVLAVLVYKGDNLIEAVQRRAIEYFKDHPTEGGNRRLIRVQPYENALLNNEGIYSFGD